MLVLRVRGIGQRVVVGTPVTGGVESVALDGFVSDADGSPADDVGPDESAEAAAQPHAVIAAAPTATSVTRTPRRPRAPTLRVRPRGRP